MKIIDANIILRYLLKDHKESFIQSVDVVENQNIFLPNEIAAEVVYVLEKVYKIPKQDISNVLRILFGRNNIEFFDKKIILTSLEFYQKYNLDYADSLLITYNKVQNAEIITFDKKLKKIFSEINL